MSAAGALSPEGCEMYHAAASDQSGTAGIKVSVPPLLPRQDDTVSEEAAASVRMPWIYLKSTSGPWINWMSLGMPAALMRSRSAWRVGVMPPFLARNSVAKATSPLP